jgi:hypothetical protein
MSSKTKAGTGEHHVFVCPQEDTPSNDTTGFQRDRHYLRIEAVRWYVNQQGNFLKKRQAGGILELVVGGDTDKATFQLGLGKYQLEQGATTAPIFDRAVLPNRRYLGGDLTIRAFVRVMREDKLLGSLLRNMAQSSLGIVAGSIATGPGSAVGTMALTAAGKSLADGIQSILKDAEGTDDVLDPGGAEGTFELSKLKGPENYIVIHRGEKLSAVTALVRELGGEPQLFRGTTPVEDGAWLLLRVRREDAYGATRPWDDDLRNARAELRELFTRWKNGDKTQDEVKKVLLATGQTDAPSLGDRFYALHQTTLRDPVLTVSEAGFEAAKIETLLQAAKKAAADNTPGALDKFWDKLERELESGSLPQTEESNLLIENAVRALAAVPMLKGLATQKKTGTKDMKMSPETFAIFTKLSTKTRNKLVDLPSQLVSGSHVSDKEARELWRGFSKLHVTQAKAKVKPARHAGLRLHTSK